MSKLPSSLVLAVTAAWTASAYGQGSELASRSAPRAARDARPSDLVQAAEARKKRAQQDLAAGRKARLDTRAKLTARLQRAYARLSQERAAAHARQSERERLERTLDRLPETSAEAEAEAARLLRLLRQAAKTPLEGNPMPPAEDVAAHVARGLEARLQALEAATRIQVREEQVIGRNGRSAPAQLIRIGTAAALAVGDAPSFTGLATAPPGETARVVGPTLDAETTAALRNVAQTGSGGLALDVDGALTRADTPAAPARAGWLAAGGFFLWPILLVGALGLILLGERVAFLTLRPVRPETIPRVAALLANGDVEPARGLVTPPRTDLDRVLAVGIDTHGRPRAVRAQRLETALLEEEPRLERSLSLLGAVAGLAPLLGLLGTVTGMITTFDVISIFGTGNPRLLSGGISVALITTQVGLIVAVPALLGHAWASRAVARRQSVLESARTTLLGLDRPPTENNGDTP